ncbi:FIG01073776: hypothetical protein [hydrothermal vent metagenome]|uniref:DUF302 domain-containing protein n=1 Tax=hydrothermal vent metagenome TaxID=652676 RepID=A0A3B0RTN1_9ZZZZ
MVGADMSLKTLVMAGVLLLASVVGAQALEPREGWIITETSYDYKTLIKRVNAAVKAAPIAIVTQASASSGARGQGFTIPGNRVFGLYRNDYARRMLSASIAAGIEAPIRLYVTENDDGTATLSYKTPTAVFSPYFDEGGADLQALASELDGIFATITTQAATP